MAGAKKKNDPAKMQVEYWAIDKLTPYVRNPRKNDHAVLQLASMIQEFGFRVPIVARSDGELVDGHLRLKAAMHLDMDEVPVVLADDWTDAQVKAFRIAVNKMAELAEWDDELLGLELSELDSMDFDLDSLGFDGQELDKLLLSDDGDVDSPDDFPEFDEEIETEHQCPKCGYEWSGGK